MSKPKNKTNADLVDLIDQLKAKSRDTGAALWRDVALRLAKSRSNWAQPNLSRVSRYAPEGATVVVPGKLLGSGDVAGAPTVSPHRRARGRSESAGDVAARGGG